MAAPSAYIRVDSALAANEKMLEVADDLYLEVAGLYVFVLGRCDLGSTDGRLTERAITGTRGIAPGRDDLLDEMIRVGLIDHDGTGLVIPDYLEWQRSSNEKISSSDRARKAAYTRHTKSSAETHAEPCAETHAETHAERYAERAKRERDKGERERGRPDESFPQGDKTAPVCLSATPLKTTDPAYDGTCYGFLLREIGLRLPYISMTGASQADFAALNAAITDGCIPGCKGEKAVECTLLMAEKARTKAHGSTIASSRLWLKCFREDRIGEVGL